MPNTFVQVERLSELENTIARGLATFVEVGAALTEIREQRLYRFRDGYTTFEQYCKERWGFSKQHAHRLMDASVVAAMASPMGDFLLPGRPRGPMRAIDRVRATLLANDDALPSIRSERVARELTPLKDDPPKLLAVWREATEANPKPTARDVRAVMQRVTVSDVEVDDEAIAEALTAADALPSLAAPSMGSSLRR